MNWNREIHWSTKAQSYIAATLFLALAIILLFPTITKELWQQPFWIRFVLVSNWPSKATREKAERMLAYSATTKDAAFITARIEQPSDWERLRWINALARIPGQTQCNTFIKLATSSDRSVRRAAFEYLINCKDTRATPLFIEALSVPDSQMRKLAIIGLGRLNKPNTITPMVNIFKQFEAPDVLSDFEILLGRIISDISGQHFNFEEKCQYGRTDIFPSGTELLQLKRRYCDNHGPVKARAALLDWWDKEEKNAKTKR